ncbi:MAG: hypothetical protein AAF378_07075 [Cyanobacteria bacterium P01_A01_bin.84]
MAVPKFQEFLQTPDAIKTQLYFGNTPPEVKPQQKKSKQSMVMLPPVFSHMDFLLIQILSETGHGEFHVRIERKNHEFVVYLNSHLSQRYFLGQKESEMMQEAYQQIITTWNKWWLSDNHF